MKSIEVKRLVNGIELLIIPRGELGRLEEFTEGLAAVVVVATGLLSNEECKEIAQLTTRGCRMFAFVGWDAEQLHDRFDGVLEQDSEDVSMTTYHVDESAEDVATMLSVHVRSRDPRRILLINGQQDCTLEFVSSFESMAREQ